MCFLNSVVNVRRCFSGIVEIRSLADKFAKLPQIRFHDMRHTHATILLLQGENPKIVSERLGHADVRITLDTYSHILPNMQKETAKNLGKLIYSESLDDEDENEI
ncbi:tyrosine-type recombinase/integrase [Paenibacillus sp. S3N08]|uniref:Tyrosine-type recombinase/integrase n=1 Tax=Paenibacillus agricola TaxID=2716264 RepID=A0ABX0JK04_9BACL|nr:tyrosine-type recombinase/integrase [Paenibacillus agricola]